MVKLKYIFLVLFSASLSVLWAQRLDLTERIILHDELNEISGLVVMDTLGYAINDSGGKACLYAFTLSTGTILYRYTLDGAKNKDFEALTENKTHIFIGDIGNNFASRSNFNIYSISKSEFTNASKKVEYKSLQFTLPNYEPTWSKKHNFDMEAMHCNAAGDSLFIYSKNRSDNTVTIYSIDTKSESQEAITMGTLKLNGMITAAAVQGQDLFLLTYKLWKTTLYKIPNFRSKPSTEWLPITINVPGAGYQRESLYLSNGVVYIASESTRYQEQCLEHYVFK